MGWAFMCQWQPGLWAPIARSTQPASASRTWAPALPCPLATIAPEDRATRPAPTLALHSEGSRLALLPSGPESLPDRIRPAGRKVGRDLPGARGNMPLRTGRTPPISCCTAAKGVRPVTLGCTSPYPKGLEPTSQRGLAGFPLRPSRRICSTRKQRSITTWIPARSAISFASVLEMPSCIHRTLAPFATA